MAIVAEQLTDEAVVTSLGNPSFDLSEVKDRPLNFYLWGAMGMAVSVGLGLAQAQPARKVVVIAGDGSLLMNVGALATVAAVSPRNLLCVVMDNGHYQLTGDQASATSQRTDLALMARGAGIEQSSTVTDEEALRKAFAQALAADGPTVIVAKVDGDGSALRPGKDPVALKYRFTSALGTVPPKML